jgi:hypothetical protein
MLNKKGFTFFIAVLFNLAVYSQVTVTGTVYTEIVSLTTAKETMQLNFGRFSPETGNGSITISPEGIRLASGSVQLLEGPFSQGIFTISGSETVSLSILLPTTRQLLRHFNSLNTLYLDKWTFNIPITERGDKIVNVGATLHFGPVESNPAGFYSGTYQIILLYN